MGARHRHDGGHTLLVPATGNRGLLSFNASSFAFLWGGFSTAAYSQATQDSTLLIALRISLEVAASTAVLSMVVGLIGGLASTGRGWSHRLLFLLFVVILATPEIVGASGDLLWFVTLGLSNGYLRLVIAHSIFGSALTALIVRGRALGWTRRFSRPPTTSARERSRCCARLPCPYSRQP